MKNVHAYFWCSNNAILKRIFRSKEDKVSKHYKIRFEELYYVYCSPEFVIKVNISRI